MVLWASRIVQKLQFLEDRIKEWYQEVFGKIEVLGKIEVRSFLMLKRLKSGTQWRRKVD